MFKLFRRYQMYLLAIMGTLLMCVFLVQGTLTSLLQPDRGSQAIGTIDGKKITLAEEQSANFDINTLKSLSPLLVAEEANGEQSGLRWLLMLRAARSLGLDASNDAVAQIEAKLGISGDEVQRAEMARKLGISMVRIDRALRDWDIIQQYKELALGLGHISAEQRLDDYELALLRAQIDARSGRGEDIDEVLGRALADARGAMRVSDPLLEHLLQETFARVQISAVAVPADSLLRQVKTVLPEEVARLFGQYRDHLPGQVDEQGYTFGYKTPDRVKIEYLAVPMSRLRANVKLDETEILSYYLAHRDDADLQPPPTATQPAPGTPGTPGTPANPAPPIPDAQTRARIINILTLKHASDEAQRAVKIAQAILTDEARDFKEDDNGYRILPAGWQPASLEWVAGQIQRQIGVLPDVIRMDNRWLDMPQLDRLPGIGQASVDGTRGASLEEYVHSAKAFSPKIDNPLAVLHLQTLMPSQPLTGMDGSRYLFRLIDAQAARAPESIDEPGVRTQVIWDAKRLAAYKLLLADRDHWSHELRIRPLASLAEQVGSPILTPPPFPRRELEAQASAVPDVQGIGPDRGFVDTVFALAEKVALRGPIDATPPAQRSEAVASNANLALYLVRIDGFESLPRSAYDRVAASPGLAPIVQSILTAGRARETDAFSLDNLEKQVGFVAVVAKGKSDEQSQPGSSAPAQSPAPLGG